MSKSYKEIEDMFLDTDIRDIVPMSTFTKDDSSKPMLSLIEPTFIISLGDILTFGAQKYSPGNWKLCEDPSRYKDALLRHTYAYLSGEILDLESGFPHTAHIACNIMFLQWFDSNTPS